MNLAQLANLGEFIGGIAVVVTLIYLAMQIRHSTSVATSSMHYQMLSITNDHFMLTSSNPELSEFAHRARNDPNALTDQEWDRFVEFSFMRFGIWEAAYVNRQAGTVAEETWHAWDGACRSVCAGPGYARFWAQEGRTHAPAFRQYIDSTVFTHNPEP